MRGKVTKRELCEKTGRITPAYAGKSCPVRQKNRYTRDHPRLCGEKDTEITGGTEDEGITPAYAGKSSLFDT